jgi:multiple sugar transport system permease protein
MAAGDLPLPALNAPAAGVNYSTRVDKVGRRVQIVRAIRITVVILFALIALIPVFWIGATAFKSRADAISVPPKVIFTPTLEGFVNLFTDRSVLNRLRLRRLQERADELSWYDLIALENGQQITGPSPYVARLRNSLIIAGGSTILAVALGLLAAYSFSRFKVPGEADLLFFILSTRMLPAVVVTIPIFIMYRNLGLHDTHLGMILLYTVFNLSLTVWLLKGFIDEIPREYEEAALVDGYTRLQAFRKVVLPQAVTGIAATTVFSLIFAWNEYAFALMLTTEVARTAPPTIPTILGRGGVEWSSIAAGTLGFLVPVVVVTFALRQYLLRGVTFGAIRQ